MRIFFIETAIKYLTSCAQTPRGIILPEGPLGGLLVPHLPVGCEWGIPLFLSYQTARLPLHFRALESRPREISRNRLPQCFPRPVQTAPPGFPNRTKFRADRSFPLPRIPLHRRPVQAPLRATLRQCPAPPLAPPPKRSDRESPVPLRAGSSRDSPYPVRTGCNMCSLYP